MGRLPRLASSAVSRLRSKHPAFPPHGYALHPHPHPHPTTLPPRESPSSDRAFLSGFRRIYSGSRFLSGTSDAGESRAEALERVKCMVDAWITPTDDGDFVFDDESKAYGNSGISTKLASTVGLVDEWNLEDWKEAEVDMIREGTRNLAVGYSGEEVQGEFRRKGEVKAKPVPKAKKVFGMDEGLPPRVLVEFCECTSIADLNDADVNKLFNLSKEDEAQFYSEGLPKSYSKEFDISGTNSLLVRGQFMKLVSHFRSLARKKTADDSSALEELENDSRKKASLLQSITHMSVNQRKKLARERRLLDKAELATKERIVLDGLPGSGKSVVLGMLVQWARSEGWLVCYIPSGRKWTHNELYYKNQSTGLWDTPVQAASMLKDFLKSHREILESIPCRIFDSIPLGEGPGIGLVSGPQEVNLKSNATLKDLIQLGLDIPHASVGVVVRLRKELSLVEEVPVLIAVDEFNSWFTFSGFHESFNDFGRRQIHAKELAMVSAFRDMTYGPFMVGAFSHCTNVGKLPKQLPGIPLESKVFLSRYDFMEASVMLKLYIRKWCPKAKFGKRTRRSLYMLTNGNANELRDVAFLTAGGLRDAGTEQPAEQQEAVA